jgi:hypothetical protein
MKLKHKIILGLIIFPIFIGIFTQVTYKNSRIVTLAFHFVDLIEKNELSTAFNMTNETNFEKFKINVSKQLPIANKSDSPVVKKIIEISPKQTMGNRIRRWSKGQKLDPDEVSIDLELTQNNKDILFLVKFKSDSNTNWKIINYETHTNFDH